MNLNDTVMASFWLRVDVRGPNDCWLWLKSKDAQGRGKFWVEGHGKHVSAPRIALMHKTGDRPSSEIFACHTCDEPACVNPAHLWWGTRSENMKDCGSKQRHGFQVKYRGAQNPQAKLTDDDVRDIRARYAKGEPPKSIREKYGLNSSSVWKIATGRSWKHVQ